MELLSSQKAYSGPSPVPVPPRLLHHLALVKRKELSLVPNFPFRSQIAHSRIHLGIIWSWLVCEKGRWIKNAGSWSFQMGPKVTVYLFSSVKHHKLLLLLYDHSMILIFVYYLSFGATKQTLFFFNLKKGVRRENVPRCLIFCVLVTPTGQSKFSYSHLCTFWRTRFLFYSGKYQLRIRTTGSASKSSKKIQETKEASEAKMKRRSWHCLSISPHGQDPTMQNTDI